jgi:MFS transporter, putative metabolite transport protein
LWRWILGMSALPAVVTMIARVGFPESPRWLLNHGRDARKVIGDRLNGDAYFDRE